LTSPRYCCGKLATAIVIAAIAAVGLAAVLLLPAGRVEQLSA